MPFRVTARLAHRLGNKTPIAGPDDKPGTLTSDVLINDADHTSYTNWLANDTGLRNYTNTGAAYAELRGVGQTASVYTAQDFADGSSDIGFQQVEYNYAQIIA